jgi:hypothetical protein
LLDLGLKTVGYIKVFLRGATLAFLLGFGFCLDGQKLLNLEILLIELIIESFNLIVFLFLDGANHVLL